MKIFKQDIITFYEKNKIDTQMNLMEFLKKEGVNAQDEVTKYFKSQGLDIQDIVAEYFKEIQSKNIETAMIEFFKSNEIEIIQDDAIKWLKKQGVDIKNDLKGYKKTQNYEKIRDEWIYCMIGFYMPLEEYIERYLLDENEIIVTYESKYDMGNKIELTIDDCEYSSLSKELLQTLPKTTWTYSNSYDLSKQFYKTNGLEDQLKNNLNFDIKLFDSKNTKYQHEIYKILYFFYTLKNKTDEDGEKEIKINILHLFTKFNMENIDNSPVGITTANGMYINIIKNSLAKELRLDTKNKIVTTLHNIVSSWTNFLIDIADKLLKETHKSVYYVKNILDKIYEYLLEYGESRRKYKKHEAYKDSPIETLYLNILKYEQISRIKGISENVNIKLEKYYNESPDLKGLNKIRIKINEIEKYIEENIKKIHRYVYPRLGNEVEQRRKMKKNANNVVKLLKFCQRAKQDLGWISMYKANELNKDSTDMVSILFIVSCFQVIILDDGNKKLNYTKKNSLPNDVTQFYLVRKVYDRLYGNLGKTKELEQLREIESICDKILIEILRYPNREDITALQSMSIQQLKMGISNHIKSQ